MEIKLEEIRSFWNWFKISQDRPISKNEFGRMIHEVGDQLLKLGLNASLWDIHSEIESISGRKIHHLSFTIRSKDMDLLKSVSDLYDDAPLLIFWKINYGVPPKKRWNGKMYVHFLMKSIQIFDLKFKYRLEFNSISNSQKLFIKLPSELQEIKKENDRLQIVENSLIMLLGENVYFNKQSPELIVDKFDETGRVANIHELGQVYLNSNNN